MKRLLTPALCLALVACDAPPPPVTEAPAVPTTDEAPWHAAEQAVLAQLNTARSERLRRLGVSASGFGDAIDGLLSDPVEERLTTARQAWSRLYQHFNEAFVVLTCEADRQPAHHQRLARADSFPILPGYIDGLAEWPDSGIVNDMALPLTRDALLAQQDATLEGEASIGFQVIHFLLHGEPGQARTAEALIEVTTLTPEMVGELADQPANRRRQYLQLATDLLVEDLLLASRDDGDHEALPGRCPVDALRETVARLIRLENLAGNTQVSQDYMASDARQLAARSLQAAITPWLQDDSALYPWLDQRIPGNRGAIGMPPGLDSNTRLAGLQALHAALAGAERTLANTRR